MNTTRKQPPHPFRGWEHGSILPDPVRAVLFRCLLALCVVLSAIPDSRAEAIIVHEHDHAHEEHVVKGHVDPGFPAEDDHDDDHEGDHGTDGEHHHHLAASPGVTLFTLPSCSPRLFVSAQRLEPLSFDAACPDGPVFELIKPPQVA